MFFGLSSISSAIDLTDKPLLRWALVEQIATKEISWLNVLLFIIHSSSSTRIFLFATFLCTLLHHKTPQGLKLDKLVTTATKNFLHDVSFTYRLRRLKLFQVFFYRKRQRQAWRKDNEAWFCKHFRALNLELDDKNLHSRHCERREWQWDDSLWCLPAHSHPHVRLQRTDFRNLDGTIIKLIPHRSKFPPRLRSESIFIHFNFGLVDVIDGQRDRIGRLFSSLPKESFFI